MSNIIKWVLIGLVVLAIAFTIGKTIGMFTTSGYDMGTKVPNPIGLRLLWFTLEFMLLVTTPVVYGVVFHYQTRWSLVPLIVNGFVISVVTIVFVVGIYTVVGDQLHGSGCTLLGICLTESEWRLLTPIHAVVFFAAVTPTIVSLFLAIMLPIMLLALLIVNVVLHFSGEIVPQDE